MSSKSIAVSVRGLSKSYTINHNAGQRTPPAESLANRLKNPLRRPDSETFRALQDVSFEVNKGDVVGIIGRNGAGKSTLLKILSRITEPTSGEVRLNGRVGSLLEVGTGFHPELTGRENIYLNGTIMGMKRREIEQQFDAIVDFAEVEQFLDTPVKRYSSGMYVRLAFAVAAHLNPEILVVDEVLAVGDAQFQKKCLGKMKDVSRQEGRTVLFVSHNMAAIQSLCHKAVLMQKGRLRQFGQADVVVPGYFSDACASRNGVFDLTNHPARLECYDVLIQDIRIRNGHGATTDTVLPGEPLCIEITIQLPQPLREPRLALAIEDSYGRRIGTVASYLGPLCRFPNASRFVATCEIPGINLGAGRYLISVSIATKSAGLLDSIDGAGWFDVLWNDYYKNGEQYFSVYGPVLMQSKWQAVPTPQPTNDRDDNNDRDDKQDSVPESSYGEEEHD